jgi:hypothetical protein
MKLRALMLLVALIAASVGSAGAQEKNLSCVMNDTHYEKQLMINESQGIAKFELDPAVSPAAFTNTTVTWELDTKSETNGSTDGHKTYNLSRTTGALTTNWNGYDRGGMPDYPHTTTHWQCEVSTQKF